MTKLANIQMVDLSTQYQNIQTEINEAVLACIASTAYINGPQVKEFQQQLEQYLDVKHVIPCANGTDALQIAMMALELKAGDEVIVPAFTYVATAEVIALLGLTPVMIDVDDATFNVTAELIAAAITPRTKAIVPVHLFGQSADMEAIMQLAKTHNLYVIEDNAQAIGSTYHFSDGRTARTGTIGHIGTTSFFPSKNLGAYGDGGAIFTNDDQIAEKIRMVANHGQLKKYYHEVVGVNSRLDSLQAAILNVKLRYLDQYSQARQAAAAAYDAALADVEGLTIPTRAHNATHVFHQYTLRVANGKRDALQKYLQNVGIPSMIYYPVPLYKQNAFAHYWHSEALPVTETLCDEVLSLPMHTELDAELLTHICEQVKSFFQA